MCGIGGIQLSKSSSLDLRGQLGAMLEKQHQRGPDHSDIYISNDQDTGLCHNRLSILDLSHAGNQPMLSHDRRYVLTFNGEIYNWRELRKGLEVEGVSFRSESDSEVLLELYAHFGAEMLQKLRGMFAFAIYDTATGEIFCARDRIGKKPFLYAELPSGIAFASNIPALLSLEGVSRELSPPALLSMFARNFRHIPDPYTIYSSIKRLRPGHALLIKGGSIKQEFRYWKPNFSDSEPSTGEIRAKIEEAVLIRTDADVPIGCLLSGGIDSSAIAAICVKNKTSIRSSFVLGRDSEDEDCIRAKRMAEILNIRHHEFSFEPERHFQFYTELIGHFGEPVALLPLIYSYELCRRMKEAGMTVALSGIGADELYYGYTGYGRMFLFSRILETLRPLLFFTDASFARSLRKHLPPYLRCFFSPAGERKAAIYADTEHGEFLSQDAQQEVQNYAYEQLLYWGEICRTLPYIDESSFLALVLENAHSTTHAADLPGMLASVEVRAPFLDSELIEQAFSISSSRKIRKRDGAWEYKSILKESVAEYVPHDLLHAPKRGFGFGLQERDLFRNEWRQQLDEVFSEPDDLGGILNVSAMQQTWDCFVAEKHNDASLVSRLLSVQLWRRAAEL